MALANLRIISADSHVVEPWDLWKERVPREFRDRTPSLLHEEDADRLVCEDVVMAPIGLAAGAFRSDSEVRREADGRRTSSLRVRPRCSYE